jgi:hypothetical protein
LTIPTTTEDAADVFAALVVGLETGTVPVDRAATLALLHGWGTSSGVAAMGWWLTANGVLSAEEVVAIPGLAWGLRDPARRAPVQAAAVSADQARRLWPLAAAADPVAARQAMAGSDQSPLADLWRRAESPPRP